MLYYYNNKFNLDCLYNNADFMSYIKKIMEYFNIKPRRNFSLFSSN